MTMNSNVYAIILAGGNGERFWPLSTPERPKQFLTLFGGKALIQHAVDRLEGVIPPERIFVITGSQFALQTRKALKSIPSANIIAEPMRRDTAAAVAVACGLVKRHGGSDAIGCILTADQLMSPVLKFRATLKTAIAAAESHDAIVTLGIVPTTPATGYGYIECGEALSKDIVKVTRFVEKPDRKTAEKYLKSGKFLWNAGMFIWRQEVMEEAFKKAAPDIGRAIGIISEAKEIGKTLRKLYSDIRATSVDYAVMEKTKNILVTRCAFKWNDVGSWSALAEEFKSDKDDNIRLGSTAVLDVKNSTIVAEDNHLIAALGVSDLVIVHTPRATLVCSKDRAQDIKKLLATLK